MKVAYIDASRGAAGDMLIGALLDAGLPLDALQRALGALPLDGYRLTADRVEKRGVPALQFLVHTGGEHRHDSVDHGGEAAIRLPGMVAGSALPEPARSQAVRVLRRYIEADAAVRGMPVEDVQYDRAHSLDLLIDVTGVCVALRMLGVEALYCSALPAGRAQIETRHGPIEIPVPLTRALLEASGCPTTPEPGQVTPTGAAILAELARWGRPTLHDERRGTGAGEGNPPAPNVLNVCLGELAVLPGR